MVPSRVEGDWGGVDEVDGFEGKIWIPSLQICHWLDYESSGNAATVRRRWRLGVSGSRVKVWFNGVGWSGVFRSCKKGFGGWDEE